MKWRDIQDDPPPVERLVWVTNWKAFCLARLVCVKKGGKTEHLWNYRSVMMPDAVAWAERKDFEFCVFPENVEVKK